MKKTDKKIWYLSFIGILLIGLVAAYFFLRPSITFVEGNKTFERGETYLSNDLILKANGEVSVEDEYLHTDEVGRHVAHFTVTKGPFTKYVPYSYEVKDTTPPVIEIAESTVIIYPGEGYDEEKMKDNVSVNAGKVEYETDLDPDFCGTYTVNVRAEDDYGNAASTSYEVIVKDDVPPFVFRTGNGAKIQRGKPFNISSIISYGDNADPVPLLTVTGKVNTAIIGDYPLHAVLTDASGNKTEWDLTVSVVSKLPENDHDDERYPFEEFIEDQSGEDRMLGIDVSEWQGDIDFEAVKEAGCEFVIMRIGFSYLGELTVDKKFIQNMEGAKAVGLPVGIYLFCYDNNEADLLSSLDQMFEVLGDEELELPVIFDWENFGNYHEYEISFQSLNRLYDVFEEKVEERGYEAMLYGSKYYLDNVWETEERSTWLAQYYLRPTYKGSFAIWQLADNGKIDGINAPVDLDVLYGSLN